VLIGRCLARRSVSEALAQALLARVPSGCAALASLLASTHLSHSPTLPVRVMRQGLHIAYGSAGAVTCIGQAMLHMSRLLLQPALQN
jgi:hypothetical protein